jgi:hypothetical protein
MQGGPNFRKPHIFNAFPSSGLDVELPQTFRGTCAKRRCLSKEDRAIDGPRATAGMLEPAEALALAAPDAASRQEKHRCANRV